jgi:hypothetical protein
MPRIYTSRLRLLGLQGALWAIYEQFVIRRGPDECWGWSGAIDNGYGRIGLWDGTRTRSFSAHRVAYEHIHGPLPSSIDVLHMCHTEECSNTSHLMKGPRTLNMQTSRVVGRLQRRIPLVEMPHVRERRANGDTLRAIASDYNCTPQAVRHMLLHGAA